MELIKLGRAVTRRCNEVLLHVNYNNGAGLGIDANCPFAVYSNVQLTRK